MAVFWKQDIVVTKGSDVPQTVDIIKTVNPFPALWPLTSNVKYSLGNLYNI